MEKFALLDFLKAFQSLSSKAGADPAENKTDPAEASASAAPPRRNSSASAAPPDVTESMRETNVMANVIARHEEISNRIKNKR